MLQGSPVRHNGRHPGRAPGAKATVTVSDDPTPQQPNEKFFFILDLEATCDADKEGNKIKMLPFPEIIEFPVYLVKGSDILSSFHCLVQP